MIRYSLIIPAYNEEKRIDLVLEGMRETSIEYIFVCEGSDRTAEIVGVFGPPSRIYDKMSQIYGKAWKGRRNSGGSR